MPVSWYPDATRGISIISGGSSDRLLLGGVISGSFPAAEFNFLTANPTS